VNGKYSLRQWREDNVLHPAVADDAALDWLVFSVGERGGCVYVRMCVRVCACMYVYVYVCVYVRVRVRVYLFLKARTLSHTHTHTHTHKVYDDFCLARSLSLLLSHATFNFFLCTDVYS
jgi:hypothetical protein